MKPAINSNVIIKQQSGYANRNRLFDSGLHFHKEASVVDWPIIGYFIRKSRERRAKKKIKGVESVLKQQARARKTVKFKYVNMDGTEKLREVDPYEIKNGFLWAAEHKNPNSIRRFFMKKIDNIQPGGNKYSPVWPVKIAGQPINFKKLIRTPALMRIAEGLIGAGVGGAYGAAYGANEDKIERLDNIIRGSLAGAATALGGSYLYRNVIVPSSIARKSQKALSGRSYMMDNSGKYIGRNPGGSDAYKIMKARREFIEKTKDPKFVRKLVDRQVKEELRTMGPEFEAQYIKYEFGNKRTGEKIEAFKRGLRDLKSDKKWSPETREAYITGKNYRLKHFENVRSEAEELVQNEINKNRRIIHAFSDFPVIEKKRNEMARRIFGKI